MIPGSEGLQWMLAAAKGPILQNIQPHGPDWYHSFYHMVQNNAIAEGN